MIVTLCSAKGAPGVTTVASALGAVWPQERSVVLAECDPAGGAVAARFGLSAKRGMTSLAVDSRHTTPEGRVDWSRHLQRLPGGLEVLAGPTGALASRTVDAEVPRFLRQLRSDSGLRRSDSGSESGLGRSDSGQLTDFVIDCGRVCPGTPAQIAALSVADHVLVVASPTLESVAATGWIVDRLTRGGARSEDVSQGQGGAAASPPVSLLLVGEGESSSAEVSASLGVPVPITFPFDPVGSRALRGVATKDSRLARSETILAARRLCKLLLELSESVPAPPPPHPPAPPVGFRLTGDTEGDDTKASATAEADVRDPGPDPARVTQSLFARRSRSAYEKTRSTGRRRGARRDRSQSGGGANAEAYTS